MMRFIMLCLACVLMSVLASGCDVPAPPPELPTATPGSQNPESEQSRFNLTPVRIAPDRGYTPLAAPPGSIYFVRASHLWRISPDGSGERELSGLPVSGPPQLSPDGKMVAFISERDVYVIPSGGGTPRKIASGEMADRQRLGWSHDGASVGYITFDLATVGNVQAWAAPIAGGEPILLATMSGGSVARGPAYERQVQWSPDGKWVLVSGVNNPMRLLRWPLSSGREGDVRDIPGGEPDWSPDSRTILYTESLAGALLTYDVLESKSTAFLNEQQADGTGLGEYAQGPGPRWSPASVGVDSDLFAYRSRSQEDGAPRVSIRRRGGRDLAPMPSFTNNPSWSPGGDQLVVETGYLKDNPLGRSWEATGLSIARVSIEGEHSVIPLTKDARWPTWGK
jgi:Tol biopolymer transport system component